MSLVGTRPPTLDEWEKYEPHHRARMSFRPGLTGLWQVSGRSNITDFEEVVKLDTQYIGEWSVKAGLWYTIGNIALKGCAFLTLPVFTRLLSTSDFGVYNAYIAYEQIFTAILGVGFYGTIKNAKLDFKENFKKYLSSIVYSNAGYYLYYTSAEFNAQYPMTEKSWDESDNSNDSVETTYAHSEETSSGAVTLKAEWNDPVLGQPTTFHVSATGGSGKYQFRMDSKAQRWNFY